MRVRAVCTLLLLAAAQLAAQDSARVLRKSTPAEDLQLFSQVLNQIRVNHPDSVDTHELFLAAINGMVHAADPHSYVIPAARLQSEKEEALRRGKLYPVPISFTLVGGSPVVTAVHAGSRAAQLDILPGDRLILIDGKPVLAESEAELDIFLAGARNSTVRLTLDRLRTDGTLAQLERTVTREKVEPENAIPTAFMLDGKTGYVRVTTFMGEHIGGALNDKIEGLENSGMQQLVLDLRDNGGGSVDEASDVAGAFLPAGSVVYTAQGRKEDVARTGKVGRVFWKHEKRYPLIIMINRGTASASELVAAALQDHDRALIVGEPSFGKALLMRYMPLSDGSLLALVVGQVKTPCGRVLQRAYRNVRRADYYRLAGTVRDTIDRPACVSDHGRRLFGGGGVYPDVVQRAVQSPPLWMSRLAEADLHVKWAGAYASEALSKLTLDQFLANGLPAEAVQQFRALASRDSLEIPSDETAAKQLTRWLTRTAAYVRWGDPGYYRVLAATDPAVQEAATHFTEAAKLVTK